MAKTNENGDHIKFPSYHIYPAIGVARLGNSTDEFCLATESAGGIPTQCHHDGTAKLATDQLSEVPITQFRDAQGRIKRQAARFNIYVRDEVTDEKRLLKIGDTIRGGGNAGKLVDIEWRVYLANKKSAWYQFKQQEGEHGYTSTHPLRNADIVDSNARQKLIIDPGPQVINTARSDSKDSNSAHFSRGENPHYAQVFPPKTLTPHCVESLGEIKTNEAGQLIVLGGFGNSGSYKTGFGEPTITSYANNDGWFDDTADGPVMARLKMETFDSGVTRFVDVQAPSWVLTAYPRYCPQILDIITLDEALQDVFIREFAGNTAMYGIRNSFDAPQPVDIADAKAVDWWKTQVLVWNTQYKPRFYRDIWPILKRPNEYGSLSMLLSASNAPHDQTDRGTFYPARLAYTDVWSVARPTMLRLVKTYAPRNLQEKLKQEVLRKDSDATPDEPVAKAVQNRLQSLGDWMLLIQTLKTVELPEGLVEKLHPPVPKSTPASPALMEFLFFTRHWFQVAVEACLSDVDLDSGESLWERFGELVLDSSDLKDRYARYRRYLFNTLRRSGEENAFFEKSRPASRTKNAPLMPFLAGDNPITNVLPSKFLKLTDTQLFVLHQWAEGNFINEEVEFGEDPEQVGLSPGVGDSITRGILANVLGGAFCPGAEIGWVMRNPSIYSQPYRINADPDFAMFRETPANAPSKSSLLNFAYEIDSDLSQHNNFDKGLQPGDLSKYMSIPWQADFNECTTQTIDVTYDSWNKVYPDSDGDTRMKNARQSWETLWWPAHHPMQTLEQFGVKGDGTPNYQTVDWTRGIPANYEGDLKMVSQWKNLGFVINVGSDDAPQFVSTERIEDND